MSRTDDWPEIGNSKFSRHRNYECKADVSQEDNTRLRGEISKNVVFPRRGGGAHELPHAMPHEIPAELFRRG